MKLIPSKLATLMMVTVIILHPTQGFSWTAKQPKAEKAMITAYIPKMSADGKSISPQYRKCFSEQKNVTCGSNALLRLVAQTEPGYIIITNNSTSVAVEGLQITSVSPNIISAPPPFDPLFTLKPYPSIPNCGSTLLPNQACLLWVGALSQTIGTEIITISGTNTTQTSINVEAYFVGTSYGGGEIFWGSGDGIYIMQTANITGSDPWANPTVTVTGAASTTDGQANTAAIVNFIGAGSYAASNCDASTVGSKNDWYLPAYQELLYLLISPLSPLGDYWSSTEVTANNAVYVSSPSMLPPVPPQSPVPPSEKTQDDINTLTRCIRFEPS